MALQSFGSSTSQAVSLRRTAALPHAAIAHTHAYYLVKARGSYPWVADLEHCVMSRVRCWVCLLNVTVATTTVRVVDVAVHVQDLEALVDDHADAEVR